MAKGTAFMLGFPLLVLGICIFFVSNGVFPTGNYEVNYSAGNYTGGDCVTWDSPYHCAVYQSFDFGAIFDNTLGMLATVLAINLGVAIIMSLNVLGSGLTAGSARLFFAVSVPMSVYAVMFTAGGSLITGIPVYGAWVALFLSGMYVMGVLIVGVGAAHD